MSNPARPAASACLALAALLLPAAARAADIHVPAGGDLQAALDAARPGDTVLLAPGATYTGNFVLPVHGGTSYVTVRSAAADALLPPAGVRISPGSAAHLPKIQSPNSAPALATRPAAAYWRLMFLEFAATHRGEYDIITLGDGSEAQTSLSQVPHHLVLDRVYVHGDPLHGQKRGVALNSGDTTIVNSYVADIKAIGQDSVAVGGWNGPGPYLIENNYLEAAGIAFLLGGADPAIPGLVPTGVIVRRNTITRPLSWRAPIVPAPTRVAASATSGGSLTAGTRHYAVTARRPTRQLAATSELSQVVSIAVPSAGRVAVTWDAVADAAEYQVWRLVNGQPTGRWTVTGTSFVDDGTTAAVPDQPAAPSYWQVKNLLELKNSRRVEISRNLLQNNWAHAQTGSAVVFTVRNQDGRCEWCVVEDVTFDYNLVRSAGGGIIILGWDDVYPSQQTNNIRIRNNVLSDLGWRWGGSGHFLQVLDAPREILVDHNTVIAEQAAAVVAVDSRSPVYGMTFTNNVSWHSVYGIVGADRAVGNDTITAYFPDGVVSRNVLAARPEFHPYPDDHLFPTADEFTAHFADYDAGDYSLQPNTDWAGAGTDGKDLGADFGQVMAGLPDSLTAPRHPRLVVQTD